MAVRRWSSLLVWGGVVSPPLAWYTSICGLGAVAKEISRCQEEVRVGDKKDHTEEDMVPRIQPVGLVVF